MHRFQNQKIYSKSKNNYGDVDYGIHYESDYGCFAYNFVLCNTHTQHTSYL